MGTLVQQMAPKRKDTCATQDPDVGKDSVQRFSNEINKSLSPRYTPIGTSSQVLLERPHSHSTLPVHSGYHKTLKTGACSTNLLDKVRSRRESEMTFESTPIESTACAGHDRPIELGRALSGIFENTPTIQDTSNTLPMGAMVSGIFVNTPTEKVTKDRAASHSGIFENTPTGSQATDTGSDNSGIYENTPKSATGSHELPVVNVKSGSFTNNPSQKVDDGGQDMLQHSGVFKNTPVERKTDQGTGLPETPASLHSNENSSGLDGYGPRRQTGGIDTVEDVGAVVVAEPTTAASEDVASDASDDSDDVDESGVEQVLMGEAVRVVKAGRQFMELGVVTDVNWGGLVKVSMESGGVKAYLPHEIMPKNSSRQVFSKGERVQVAKAGTMFGCAGVVTHPLFGFRTKVTMDDASKKSFLSHELTRC